MDFAYGDLKFSLFIKGKFCKKRQFTECGIKEHIQKHLAKVLIYIYTMVFTYIHLLKS